MAPTRRQVIAGTGAVVGTVAVSGTAASQLTAEEIDTWEPPAGTWPCGRYGPGETLANPNASVSSNPTVEWRTELPIGRRFGGFVVGPERVYVSGNGVTGLADGDGLTALDRRDGSVQWARPEPHGHLVLRDGTLYLKGSPWESTLSAFDAGTGEPQWRTTLPEAGRDVTATSEYLVVDGRGYRIADGSHAWSVEGGRAIASAGALYSQHPNRRLAKYDDWSVLDDTLDGGPDPVWQREYDQFRSPPVGTDGRGVSRRYGDETGAALAGLDRQTGRQSWAALTPAEFAAETDTDHGDPDDFGFTVSEVAVTADRCFAAASPVALEESASVESDGSALFALSMSDGSVDWSRSVGPTQSVYGYAVAGETLVVALDSHQNGQSDQDGDSFRRGILGLDVATGETEWRVPTALDPRAIAVADDTVFVVADDPLRDGTDPVLAIR